MAFRANPQYQRLQLVKISANESVRLDVPKDRPWLVVQSNDIRDSIDVVVCEFISKFNADGTKRRKLTTDVEVAAGTVMSPKYTSHGSYIRCSQLYSAKASEIEYLGTLPGDYKLFVDLHLIDCLGLWPLIQEPGKQPAAEPKRAAVEQKKKEWAGHDQEPIKQLLNKKHKAKAVTRRKK